MRQIFPRILGLTVAFAATAALASHPQPVSNLQQRDSAGNAIPTGAIIPTGATVSITAESSSATCNSSSPTYQMDLEIRPTGTPFTNTPTNQSALMAKPSCVQQTYPPIVVTLPAGDYHWQVREVSSGSPNSTWQQYNNGLSAFIVAPPNVPDILVQNVAISSVSSQPNQLDFVVNPTFENRGTVATGNFVWNAYLSTDKILQVGTDQLIYSSSTPISVGATTTLTDASTLVSLNPRPPPGAYYVIVEADPAPQGCTTNCGTVSEFDETNNSGSMPNYFISGVDLVATSITGAPANAGPGQPVTLTVNFFNQGIDAPPNPVEFRIVATRDATIGADDSEVYRSSMTVGGGQAFNLPITFTLPAGIAGGDVFWGLQVDPPTLANPNPTVEALENNNTALTSGKTHVQQADLEADSADLVNVATGLSTRMGDIGEPARFKVQVSNIGDYASLPYKVGVVISKDTTLSLLVDKVFADVDAAAVLPGAANAQTLDLTVNLPTTDKAGNALATGDYYFFVVLDSFNAINELNEANNTMGVVGPVRLRSPASDYAVLRLDAPLTAAAGEALPIFRIFQNVGTQDGSAITYGCYASANADIRPTDFKLSFIDQDGNLSPTRTLQLARGQSDATTEWVRLPGALPQGTYYLGCILDPENQAVELDETNNALANATATQVSAQTFRIVTQQLPDATVNMPFMFRLTTQGAAGPVTWAVDGMAPEGLAVSPTDGDLVGIPTQVGLTTLHVTASDGRGVADALLTVRVLPPSTQLTITTDKLPPVTNSVQLPYQAALSASGGAAPYTWSILSGTLPNGLSLEASTGIISGAPRPGVPNTEFKLTVQVKGELGTVAQKQISLRTLPVGALSIVTLALPDAKVGDDYIADLAAAIAGTGMLAKPLEWSIVGGMLPPGLALNTHVDQQTGLITGKPTTAGAFPFTVQVKDADNRVDTVDFVVRIFPSALKVTLQAPPPQVVHPGDGVDLTVVASGAGGATFRLFAGALPPGVSLTEDGKISGTVGAGTESTWNFAVEARDPMGSKGLGAFALTVTPVPVAEGCSSTSGGASFAALLSVLALAFWRRRAKLSAAS